MKHPKNFKVWDGGRGHIFATLPEAERYAEDIRRLRNEFVAITAVKSNVTHFYPLLMK